MEIPERKPNRIPSYDYAQDGAYFVTICTQNRKPILSSIAGDGVLISKPFGKITEQIVKQITTKYPSVSVDKYVIMPDHIHLLLRINAANGHTGTGDPSPTVGNVIGWFKYQTSKQINLLRNTPGQPVFQRSYYDHVIRNQQDYNEVWEYIANNPQKKIIAKQGRF